MSLKMFNYDGTIVVREVHEGNVIDHIPAAVYKVRLGREGLIMVKDRDVFTMPEKTYGRHNYNKQRITEAYRTSKGSTGVILAGLKGSGKSLLGEDIGNHLLKQDIPVFMIDAEIPESLLRMVIKLAGPGGCMLYFDEFGKIYGKEARKSLLTFFSDSSFEKVMFVVTSNETKELNQYMIDRPGRFRFYIDYKALDQTAIAEMLDDAGLDGAVRAMVQAYVKHHHITFDMLRFIVPIAANCTSVAEFRDEIEILNCPAPVHRSYYSSEIVYQGEEFTGNVKLTWDDEDVTIELIPYGSVETAVKQTFNLSTVQKVMLNNNAFSTTYRVKATEDLMIELDVRWTSTDTRSGQWSAKITTAAQQKAELEAAEAKK